MNYKKGVTTGTLKRFTKRQWEGALQECRDALIDVAKRRGQITYGDLTVKISSIHFEPYEVDLGRLVGELSEESFNDHGFMISALVVHKYGDQEPGNGFFTYAANLGLNVRDRLKFWIEEVKKTHLHWST